MKHQRTPAAEKAEILELVRKSPLSIKETLAQLGLPPATYYAWRKREATVADFQQWYNHERYHQALGNLRPADVYNGLDRAMRNRTKHLKQRTLAARRQYNLTRRTNRSDAHAKEADYTCATATTESIFD
jgi:transposase-like protein